MSTPAGSRTPWKVSCTPALGWSAADVELSGGLSARDAALEFVDRFGEARAPGHPHRSLPGEQALVLIRVPAGAEDLPGFKDKEMEAYAESAILDHSRTYYGASLTTLARVRPLLGMAALFGMGGVMLLVVGVALCLKYGLDWGALPPMGLVIVLGLAMLWMARNRLRSIRIAVDHSDGVVYALVGVLKDRTAIMEHRWSTEGEWDDMAD